LKTTPKQPSYRASLATMYQSISLSHPTSLAAFMSYKDPADDMVEKLEAKIGLDRSDDIKLPPSFRSTPDLPVDGPHAQRFSLHSVDMNPDVTTQIQPPAQNEPKSSTSWESSISKRSRFGVQKLYGDMDDDVNKHIMADQWGEFAESAESQLSRNLKNVAPRTVAKVLQHDGNSQKPVAASGSQHLGKTVEKYSTDVESDSEEGSSPISVSSLPKLYLHHGRIHGPHEEEQVDHLRINPDDMVTVSRTPPPAPVNPTSLAKSLRAHVEAEKTHELRERVLEKIKSAENSTVAELGNQQEQKEKEASENSAISSIHRSPSAKKLKFKVLPEDIHHDEVSIDGSSAGPDDVHDDMGKVPGNTTRALPPNTRSPPKVRGSVGNRTASKQQPTVPSTNSDWELQFNASAVNGYLDGKSVDEVLSKITSMKNPSSWNWRLFDLDGDGKLSRREFMNAKQVAMRLKSKK